MVLVATVLQTNIGTRMLGMKGHEGRIEDEVLVCILLEMDTQLGYWDNGVSLFPLLKILSQAGSSSTTISHAKVLKSVQVITVLTGTH